jgi:hypothetical protein
MIILLYESAHPHEADLTKVTLATVGWEIMTHNPYNADLTPSDFHFFGPVKLYLGRLKFQTDGEVKCSVLNWLCGQDKTFYTVGISNLLRCGNNVLM